MRRFESCLTAALFFVAGAALTDRAEADLIRLASGGEIRCTTIWKTGTTVNCAWASGEFSFPETMIKEIIYDDNDGYAAIPSSGPVLEAKTYKQGTREEALVGAAGMGNVEAVTRLIADGTDINGLYAWEPPRIGSSGLHGATISVQRSISSTHSGLTPLMLAASQGNVGMVQLLLEKGANPNLRRRLDDKGESSALCRAVKGTSASHQETVRLLLSRYPDKESLETAFASIARDKHSLTAYLDVFLEHGISAQCRQQVLMKAKQGIGYTARMLEEAYRKRDQAAQTRK